MNVLGQTEIDIIINEVRSNSNYCEQMNCFQQNVL